jgi:hypothetical protein
VKLSAIPVLLSLRFEHEFARVATQHRQDEHPVPGHQPVAYLSIQ